MSQISGEEEIDRTARLRQRGRRGVALFDRSQRRPPVRPQGSQASFHARRNGCVAAVAWRDAGRASHDGPEGRSWGFWRTWRRSARGQPSSALRPTSVILKRPTSIVFPPALTGFHRMIASPFTTRTPSITSVTLCTSMMESVTPVRAGAGEQRENAALLAVEARFHHRGVLAGRCVGVLLDCLRIGDKDSRLRPRPSGLDSGIRGPGPRGYTQQTSRWNPNAGQVGAFRIPRLASSGICDP